jgi:hypothetical protein
LPRRELSDPAVQEGWATSTVTVTVDVANVRRSTCATSALVGAVNVADVHPRASTLPA